MATKKTRATAVKLSQPTAILLTPIVDGVLSADTIFFEDVVRDTTSFLQDENDETSIQNEIYDDDILQNIYSGKYQFAATVGDTQQDLMSKLLGFSTNTAKTSAYAPAKFKEIWAKVSVVFENDGELVALTAPKLKLNSRASFESLATGMGQILLAGTAYPTPVTVDEGTVNTPFHIDYDFTMPA